MPAKARRWVGVDGDYVVESGNLRGDDGFTSKATLALKTRKGSCLVFPEFGSRLHEIETADERGRKLAEKRAYEAVAHLAEEVDDLRVAAALSAMPGQFEIVVSGKKGAVDVSARYTAAVGSGS